MHSSEQEALWGTQGWWVVSAGQAGPYPHHTEVDRVLQGLDPNHLWVNLNRHPCYKGSYWLLWVPVVVISLAIAKSSNTYFRIVDCNLLSYVSGEVIFLCGTDMQILGSQL